MRRALTSSFSLSSRASFSFFRRSLISLSLTTQAAAPSAAASGCDLFLNRSTRKHVSKYLTPTNAPPHAQERPPCQEITIKNKLTSLQCRNAELVIRDRVRKLLGQLGKLDAIQGLGRVLAGSNVLLYGRWEICLVLGAECLRAGNGFRRRLRVPGGGRQGRGRRRERRRHGP